MSLKVSKRTAKRMGWGAAAIIGFAVLAILPASPAFAVSDPNFDGNVFISSPGGVAATINFAVFHIVTPADALMFSSLPFTAGAGSAPVLNTTLGNYVYLYQPANNGGNGVSVISMNQSLGLAAQSPSSFGYLTNQVFTDGATHVDAAHSLPSHVVPGFATANAGDMQLNPVGFFGTVCDPVPANGVINTAHSIQSFYCNNPPTLTDLAVGDTSSIVALTSNVGPIFSGVSIIGAGGSAAQGSDPAPSPEPSTMLLSSIGFLALGGTWIKGRLLARA